MDKATRCALATAKQRKAIDRMLRSGLIPREEALRIIARQTATPKPGSLLVLPHSHYRVNVTYAPMPSLAGLKEEFGENRVSAIFDGRPWELHPSCVGMDRRPGERIFYFHDVGREWGREERITWGLAQRVPVAPKGYRPATHDEEYEFTKAHPELLDYAALGDSALGDFNRCVAHVWSGDGLRVLGGSWAGSRFPSRYRVLLVSKSLHVFTNALILFWMGVVLFAGIFANHRCLSLFHSGERLTLHIFCGPNILLPKLFA